MGWLSILGNVRTCSNDILHSITLFSIRITEIHSLVEEADRKREEAAKLDETDGRSFWFATPVNPPSDRLLSNLSMDVDKPESPVVERPENTNSVAPVIRDRSPPPKPAVVETEVRVQQSVRPAVPNSSHAAPTSHAAAKTHETLAQKPQVHPSRAQNVFDKESSKPTARPAVPKNSNAAPTSHAAAKTHETLAQKPQVHPSRAQDVFDKESSKSTAISSTNTKPVPSALPPTSNDITLPNPHASTSSNQLEGQGNSSASTVQVQPPPLPKLTKKQQRLLKKAQKIAASAASTSLDNQPVSVPSEPVQAAPEPTTSISANISSTSNEIPTESRDPFLDLHAGFWTEMVCQK